jgi:hypothetical protein
MRSSDYELELMMASIRGDKNALKEIREKLDSKLVSEQEITDLKLLKMITTLLDP